MSFNRSELTDPENQGASGVNRRAFFGLALASLLLALIALNCEESSTGMIVTFAWSLIVGATQFYGVARIPFLMKSSVEPDDMSAGVVWSLYPVCLSLMLGACALTIKSVRVRAGQSTRMPLARVHRHAFGTTVAIPAALAVASLSTASLVDQAVADYVLSQPGARDFALGYADLLAPMLSGYLAELKPFVTIAVGCTGGKHRSVACSEAIAKRLREHGCGGGAVAGNVIGLGGDFLRQLGAQVLVRVVQFNLAGNGHAVVGDDGRTPLLIEHNIAPARAKGYLDRVCQLIDAGLQGLAGGIVEFKLLSHVFATPSASQKENEGADDSSCAAPGERYGA